LWEAFAVLLASFPDEPVPLSVDVLVVDPLQAAATRLTERATAAAIVVRVVFIDGPLAPWTSDC
jgi:hypothetical protein